MRVLVYSLVQGFSKSKPLIQGLQQELQKSEANSLLASNRNASVIQKEHRL